MSEEIKISINHEFKNSDSLISFLNSLPIVFDKDGEIIFSGRNTIKRFLLNGIILDDFSYSECIVKKFKKLNFIQRVIYSFFRTSKAKRAFHNAEILKNLHFDTPLGIAYIELWDKGLLKESYYISTSDYSQPIKKQLIDCDNFDLLLARNFAYFVATLHEKGILHHDLNSTNVLFHFDDTVQEYKFSLIDINRMTFIDKSLTLTKKQCFDNLTRFTGRMDLFVYVLKYYIIYRGWDVDFLLPKAIKIKLKHDEGWKRRKNILKIFK